MSYPLGVIGRSLKKLGRLLKEKIPPIQCVVVNAQTGIPGEGFYGFLPSIKGPSDIKGMSAMQKRGLVDKALTGIFTYQKWDNVLKEFGLKPALIDHNVEKIVRAETSNRMGAGGEGKEHERLKKYVKKNPICVKVNFKILHAEIEKELPSHDLVDVFFDTRKWWVGVEVKSKISDEADIHRGLYQCVKYRAVLESFRSAMGFKRDVRVLLALGGELPRSLVSIRNILDVEVIENVGP